MAPQSPHVSGARMLAAGAAVAVSDGLAAVLFGFARTGAFRPLRTFQGIAAGVLGPAAFNHGYTSAALGLVCHAVVACAWVTVYASAFRRAGWLRRVVRTTAGTAIVAVVFGTCVWVVMSLVVMPLSAATPPVALSAVWFYLLVIHWIAVGLPTAILVR